MPWDPSIILGAKQYTGPDAGDTMRTLSQLALQGAQKQHVEATLADLASQRQRQMTADDVTRQYASAPPEQLVQAFRQRGLAKEAQDAETHAAQLQGTRAQYWHHMSQLDVEKRKQQHEEDTLISSTVGPAKTPEEWEAGKSLLLQRGVSKSKIEGLGEFAPGKGEMYLNMVIPPAERFKTTAAANAADKRQAFEASEHEKDRTNRTTNAGIIAGQKAGEADAKVETGKRKRYLEGFQLDPDAEPSDDEMRAARKAQASARTMSDTIGEIQTIYKKYGNSPLPGPVKARMEALTTDLMLVAKGPEMYALGVIAGPDEKLLGKVVSQPTTAESTILDFIGDDQSMARLSTLRGQVFRRFENGARSLGFRPKGAKTTPAGQQATGPVAEPKYTKRPDGQWEVDE